MSHSEVSVELANLPVGQAKQVVCATRAYCPATQLSHSVAPWVLMYRPLAQSVHMVFQSCMVVLYWPAAHKVHEPAVEPVQPTR